MIKTYKEESTLQTKIKLLTDENSKLKAESHTSASGQDLERIKLRQEVIDSDNKRKQAEAQLAVLKERIRTLESTKMLKGNQSETESLQKLKAELDEVNEKYIILERVNR